jgi:signal transduction histidine kinase
LLAIPQGLLSLLLGLALAPPMQRWNTAFARAILGPTRSTELAQRVRRLAESRAETVDTQAAELRRIERDLHDGTQARLVTMGMSLGLAEELFDTRPQAARRLLAEARESSSLALAELRSLVRGIHPPVLAERGLAAALRALALALPLPVRVDIELPGRPPAPVESAAYFAAAEALTNVAKHSDANQAWLHVRYSGDRLSMTVGDDGTGGADPRGGTGLRAIQRRLAALDGTLALASPPGGPTILTMELPCELSSPKTSSSYETGWSGNCRRTTSRSWRRSTMNRSCCLP